MAKYRKKPVVVEARQLPTLADAETDITHYLSQCILIGEWCYGVSHMMVEDDEELNGIPGPHMVLTTIHGEEAIARPGDWVILEPKPGRAYPCKPDIFDESYELVEA